VLLHIPVRVPEVRFLGPPLRGYVRVHASRPVSFHLEIVVDTPTIVRYYPRSAPAQGSFAPSVSCDIYFPFLAYSSSTHRFVFAYDRAQGDELVLRHVRRCRTSLPTFPWAPFLLR